MATPLAHSSSSFHVTASAVVRSDSLASSASGQSTASLSRRPRTRSRPRALTLNAPKPREKAAQPGVPDVPMLTAPEMFDADATGMLDASRVPDRPPRSPLREQPSLLSSSPVEITARDSFATTDDAAFELRNQNVRLEDEVERRRRKRGSSVPRDAYRLSFLSSASSPTSSLFPYQHPMHMQTMPNFPTLRETRQRLRDSYLTAFSGTSTSVYPFSTSTGSGTDSPPSPRSLVESYHDQAIRHVNPDDKDEAGFDPDDVSYRLRLMLNNSYFLPPAHSKPSPAQLGPISPEVKKPQAKGFLELFRPRSKSKPESPVTPTNLQDPVPVLRTTSDGSMVGFQRTPPTQSSAVSPNVPNAPAQTARVAVVRETLDDLMAAAKQAEREIKALETQDAAEKKPAYDDVIDPTDAIDLPPPATNSLVPVQTSTLVGLGVEQSVGAAELAVQLPPGTPSWSIDPNDSWRKALLHEAVSLSLESTPTRPQHSVRKQMSDASMSTGMTSANQSGSTSMSSGTTNTRSRSATSVVNRRILMPDRLEDVAETGVQIPAHSSAQWPTLRTHASVPDARSRAALSPSLVIPSMPTRVESPQTPHTPLLPPPRKGQYTQMDLSNVESSRSPSPTHSASSLGVGQSSSSPRLHSEYDLAPSHRLSQLAEPSGTQHIPKTSLDSTESESTLEGRRSLSPSVTTSIGNMSLSAPPTPDPYRPSPTQSAFHDARIDSYRPSLSSNASTTDLGGDAVTQRLQPSALDPPARSASIPFEETLLPPPRTSSSLAYAPLRPPPRSSSFMTRPVPSSSKRIREPSPRPSISSSDPGHSVFVSAVDLREPSPHRPSTARSEQARSPYLPRASTSSQGSHSRHRRGHADVALQAPGAMISHALRDVPATSIEFFDQVEAAGRADEWGDEDDGAVSSSTDDYGSVWAAPMRSSPSPSASPRPSLHSSRRSSPHRTPQKARPAVSSSDSLPLPPRSPISGPVGNTPARTIGYFKDTRSPGTALEPVRARLTRPATAPSSARAVQDDVASIHSGESHESAVSTGRIGLGRTPSMLRLDGMLMRHMEAEREAFQRIAKASKAGSVRSGTT